MEADATLEISRRILLVDDEINVLHALRRQLRGKFDVVIAQGPEAGLQAIAAEGPFAVVLSDNNMPGMTGIAFLQKAKEITPDTVLVMLTGLADLNVVISALHEGRIYRFLTKPCPAPTMVETLNDCLEQYRLVTSERQLTARLNHANEELRTLNEDLERRVAERTASLHRIHRFMADLNGLEGIEQVGRVVVNTTADVLRSGRVSLMMPDSAGEYLRIVASVGVPQGLADRIRVPVGGPIAGLVYSENQTIVVNNAGEMPRHDSRYDDELFVSTPLACACLSAPGAPVGVLNVTERIDRTPYDQESLATLKAIVEAGAIALMNQIRLEQRNEARDATILALARLAEHRDPETGAHLERVQSYCRILSETLAKTPKHQGTITQEFIDHIVRSSPLHDIGKVGIPDGILQKKGRLTPEEMEVMRRHTIIGGDTIQSILNQLRTPSFLHMGMQIAYSHHEKYDGTGYPKQMKGDEIPLASRILALADVYDALTSKRCYKEPMPHDEATALIRSERGRHFDPDVVDAFVSQEEAFRRLAGELLDDTACRLQPEPCALVADAG